MAGSHTFYGIPHINASLLEVEQKSRSDDLKSKVNLIGLSIKKKKKMASLRLEKYLV